MENGTIFLDGQTIPASSFTSIGSSGFSTTTILPLADGSHTTTSLGVHGITVGGVNLFDSYLYAGGAGFEIINHRGDAHPPLCSTEPGPAPPVHSIGVAEDSRPSEDANNNGILDPGEDLNGNGLIDRDKGIFSVQLKEGAHNLVLTTDSFIPGTPQVTFRVDVPDPTQSGTGAVVVTDGAGNQCEQQITLVPWIDTDGDGVPDSQDGCLNDVEKTAPGVCGCGIADVDANANGIIDCRENTDCLTCADDVDGDGSPADIDCDDTNSEIHPGATEVLGNGTDDDCIPGTPDAIVPAEFSCVVVTNKDFYSVQETVQANVLVRRTGGASLAAGLQLAVKATHENGDALGAKSEMISPLIPHEERALNFTFSTENSVAGAFTVSAQAKAGSEVVASCSIKAAIASSAVQSQNLTGSIEAVPSVATVGEEVSLHYSVRNTGNVPLDSVQIKILVVNLATENIMATLTDSSQLTPGAIHTAAQVAPSSLPAGEYLIILRAGNNSDKLSTLANDSLILTGGAPNQTPVADAGDDRNVEVGQPVKLDGSDSFDPDGDQITYAWSVVSVPPGSQVEDDSLTDKTTPMPTFTPDIAGKYVFRLIVNDTKANSTPDEVEITAAVANVPPNAEAGTDQEVLVGIRVELDGQASNDPDNGPQPLTYSWTFVQVPTNSVRTNADISGASQAQASFVPDKTGTYILRLTVSDGAVGDSDETQVIVRVQNIPPIANAGADQTLRKGAEAILDGRGSSDPDNGPQPLTYSWRLVSKPPGSLLTNADITGSETTTPKLLPDVTGSYVLELEVFDGEASAFDNVSIEVTALPSDTCTSATVLDNFNRADGNVGNNWRGVTGTSFYRIAGNRLDIQAGGPLFWNPTAFGPNQAASVTLSMVDPTSPSQGVLLKVQSGTMPDAGAISVVYDAKAKAVRVSTFRLGALAWTPYGNTAIVFANGDTLGACAKANGEVRVYKNDALVKTVTLSAADQKFFNAKGGKVGIWSLLAHRAFLDNFGGATVGP